MNRMNKSRFYRLVDRLSFRLLLTLLSVGILGAAISYWLLTMYFPEHGLKLPENESLSLLKAVYFSIVTASSLGYGDFSPLGLSRAVAVIEILTGYVALGLFVTKLASEPALSLRRIASTIEGVWLDSVTTDSGDQFYGLVNFAYEESKGMIRFYGENVDSTGRTLHTFSAESIATGWPSLVFRYEHSPAASGFARS